MQKLNTGYIPIYLSARTCCVKSIDDFLTEFSLNFLFLPHHLDLLFCCKGQWTTHTLRNPRRNMGDCDDKLALLFSQHGQFFPCSFSSCLLFTKFLQKLSSQEFFSILNLSQKLIHSYLQFYMQPLSTQVVLVQ